MEVVEHFTNKNSTFCRFYFWTLSKVKPTNKRTSKKKKQTNKETKKQTVFVATPIWLTWMIDATCILHYVIPPLPSNALGDTIVNIGRGNVTVRASTARWKQTVTLLHSVARLPWVASITLKTKKGGNTKELIDLWLAIRTDNVVGQIHHRFLEEVAFRREFASPTWPTSLVHIHSLNWESIVSPF